MRTKILLLVCLLQMGFGKTFIMSQTWSRVGDSTQMLMYDSVTPYGEVFVIRHIDSLLYVGGAFRYAGIIRVNSIATWDGVKWDSLGCGIYSSTHDICKFNNDIYLGGIGGWVKFNGYAWENIGNGLTASSVNALNYKNILYLGGNNIKYNNAQLNCIAGWDGSNYSGLGGGVTGMQPDVDALCVYNDELIVGGIFDYAGSSLALNIARWDGNNWKDMQTGVSSRVYSLVTDSINNFLYVGGQFYFAGNYPGMPVPGIVRWNGYQWDCITTDMPFGNFFALAVYNNKLFGGGALTGWLIKFDFNSWQVVPNGPNSTIKALEVYNDELYVGGGFNMVGQDTMIGIARYHEPPDTVSCTFIQPLIHAMPYGTVDADDTIKITPPYHIQFYTNNKYASSWAWDFGDGNTANTREPAHTYTAPGTYNVTLEVIHPHNLSSQVCTLSVSKTITIVDNTNIEEQKPVTTDYLWQNIPNPFSNTTTIPYYVPAGSKGFLQITDTKGELIDEYALQQGHNKLEISMAGYKAGVYFYSLVLDGVVKGSRRMVFSNDY